MEKMKVTFDMMQHFKKLKMVSIEKKIQAVNHHESKSFLAIGYSVPLVKTVISKT